MDRCSSVKLQRYDHPWCGPTALQNALRAIGLFIRQEELVHLCSTDEEGTDEHGMLAAISRLPVSHVEISCFSCWEAISRLDEQLRRGRPVVICVDSFDHWVCVVGRLGSRYIVVDSTNEEWNTSEQGCWSVEAEELSKKWKASPNIAEDEAPFYGISINRDESL